MTYPLDFGGFGGSGRPSAVGYEANPYGAMTPANVSVLGVESS